jgi:type I restriction enzyme S subunit
MKEPWPKVPIGRVLRQCDTSVPTGQLVEIQLAGVYSFGRGLFLRGQMAPGKTTYKTYNRLVTDDFVVSQPKGWEGALARVTKEFDGSFLSPVFATFRADRSSLEPGFLECFCKREAVWAALRRGARGIGARRESVSPQHFLSLEMPLPPLAEQQRLVARVGKLASLVKEASALRQRACEEAEALVISLHAHIAGKRTRALGQMLVLEEHSVPVSPTGSYPQVGVKSFGGGLFRKTAVAGTATTYRAFNRLYEGAVLLSQVKGWEGAVAVCPSELAGWFVSPEYRTFRCVPAEARPRYLAAIVRTEWFWSKLGNASRGVGARRERIRPERFLQVELPMPDVEQQKRAERLFAEVDALKCLQAETAAQLEALLPATLDKAFKGEL